MTDCIYVWCCRPTNSDVVCVGNTPTEAIVLAAISGADEFEIWSQGHKSGLRQIVTRQQLAAGSVAL